MMAWMRGPVARAIFGVLLVSFLLLIVVEWGMQGRMGGEAGSVASVNGERVSAQEFWMIYNQELDGPLATLRASLTAEDEKELRQQVLDRLIDQTLLWQEAKKLKVAVSPEETQTAIRAMPVFMNPQTGQHDPYRYQTALQRIGIPQTLFEMEQERSLSAERVGSFMREAVRVTDLELWLEYLRWHRKMRAIIITFPLAEAKAKLKITPEEIQNYWDQNKAEFMKAEKVRIRHIVVAANPQGGPEAAAQARAKAEAILAEIRKGKDFATVAREKSDDASTQARGGDLGWRQKGELIPEYDAVVFKLRTGGLSEIFQTKFGFHIIKCDEHQQEDKPTFAQVKEKIREKILTGRAKEQLGAEVTRASWYARRDKDLLKVATRITRKPIVTNWFEWSKTPPGGLTKKQLDALVKAMAGLEAGETTEIVETDEGWLLAQLADESHIRAEEKGFLKDRAEIEPALLARKQKSAYDAWIASLKEQAKIKKYLEGA